MPFLILLEMKLGGSANVQGFVGISIWRYVETTESAERLCSAGPNHVTPIKTL